MDGLALKVRNGLFCDGLVNEKDYLYPVQDLLSSAVDGSFANAESTNSTGGYV